jgi:DNA (cytosine-5)-methyltransferase 1
MRELALFAGAGGGILGGTLLGWRTVCAVEINAFCREVLLRRQLDGCRPRFPIWDDVTTFDGKPWRGCVDIVTGGFPCQDISCAGKGGGIEGERSGLWKEMARIVSEVRPRYALVENSPMLIDRGLGTVLGDLAEMGLDARWGVLGGYDAGLCADGKRLWIIAHAPNGLRRFTPSLPNQIDVAAEREASRRQFDRASGETMGAEDHAKRLRDSDGVADDMDRLHAIGNGQIPRVVALAWRMLGPTASC